MIKRRYIKQYKGRQRIAKGGLKGRCKTILLFTMIIAITAIALEECFVAPNIKSAAGYRAKIIATEIISEKTSAILNELNVEYSSLIEIKTDDIGKVIAIETNVNAMNQLKSKLTTEITKSLNEVSTYQYTISLGTLIGSKYLTGRGPAIKLRFEPTGLLQADFKSEFNAAGINQTHHQIILTLTVDITTYMPFYNDNARLSTNYIVAETIIVGEVPEYYTNVVGADDRLESKINDYVPDKKNIFIE